MTEVESKTQLLESITQFIDLEWPAGGQDATFSEN